MRKVILLTAFLFGVEGYGDSKPESTPKVEGWRILVSGLHTRAPGNEQYPPRTDYDMLQSGGLRSEKSCINQQLANIREYFKTKSFGDLSGREKFRTQEIHIALITQDDLTTHKTVRAEINLPPKFPSFSFENFGPLVANGIDSLRSKASIEIQILADKDKCAVWNPSQLQALAKRSSQVIGTIAPTAAKINVINDYLGAGSDMKEKLCLHRSAISGYTSSDCMQTKAIISERRQGKGVREAGEGDEAAGKAGARLVVPAE